MHHFVSMCDGGIGDAFVLKLDCVGQLFALGVLDMTIVCAIMFWQCEEIPSIYAHVLRSSVFSCTWASNPIGASGILL